MRQFVGVMKRCQSCVPWAASASPFRADDGGGKAFRGAVQGRGDQHPPGATRSRQVAMNAGGSATCSTISSAITTSKRRPLGTSARRGGAIVDGQPLSGGMKVATAILPWPRRRR